MTSYFDHLDLILNDVPLFCQAAGNTDWFSSLRPRRLGGSLSSGSAAV